MIYDFACSNCGHSDVIEQEVPQEELPCPACGTETFKRQYGFNVRRSGQEQPPSR